MRLGGAGTDLQTLLEIGATGLVSDAELLARFAGGRGDAPAEAAFAALVARHGPMVWGTCRRILRDSHAAEDAFQATFLILARKAGSVRVDDSLGRWLHGVGVRVALRARATESRRAAAGVEEVESSSREADPDLADLRSVVDEEVDRLPPSYRSVVVLCHLEGLTRELAADRLGCPVGTVNSRLSRAGELLRARLTRRGLAPESRGMVAWLATSEGQPVVPTGLVGATLANSIRIAKGAGLAGMVPAGVAALIEATLRRMGMMTLMKTTALGAPLLALAGFVAGTRGQDPGQVESPKANRAASKSEGATVAERAPTLMERFDAIKAEWEAATKQAWAKVAKSRTKEEWPEVYARLYPKDTDYYQRCLDLADAAPDDPGAREAWLWIVTDGMRNNDSIGLRGEQIGKAVDGLLAHHATSIRVIRSALNISNMTSQHRTRLLRGLRSKADTHEAEGVSTLALAQYLPVEAAVARWARATPVQVNQRGTSYDESGAPKFVDLGKFYSDGYWKDLAASDPEAMERDSDELLELVIDRYADVAYSPWMYEGEKLVKNPNPKSLADHARAKLDDRHGLAIGQPMPAIAGVDLEVRPLRLSDFKGKVVAVVFWNSGCGPCLASVPHERALLEKLKDRPFAILGVNTDEKPEAAKKAVAASGMTWPSWRDGLGGPIADRFHIAALPTTYVVDAEGVIRSKNAHGSALDEVVEGLLAKPPAKAAAAN